MKTLIKEIDDTTCPECEKVCKTLAGLSKHMNAIHGGCLHPNATIEMLEYSKPSWWADAHCYVNDDSEDLPTLVCPDCGYEEIQEPEDDYYEE